ncbi:MAG: RsiG family protein [Ferrimicrobium sp.]
MVELQQDLNEFLGQIDELDVVSADTDVLRTLRERGRYLENLISYSRRILQTRLDVARGESATGSVDRVGVVPEDEQHTEIAQRYVSVALSEDETTHAEDYVRGLVGGDRSLSLDLLTSAQRTSYIARLDEGERHVSSLRRQVHERLDVLAGELVRRYSEGVVAISEIGVDG